MGDDSRREAPGSSTPLLAKVLDLEIQLEVTAQLAEELIHLHTETTHHLTEVFLLEQAILTVAETLQSQVREVEATLEEANRTLSTISQALRVGQPIFLSS